MSKSTVNIHEAKTHLSALLERVGRGETITIARAGTPVAELRPLTPARRVGFLSGAFTVPDDFDRMGDDEIAQQFEGSTA